MITTKFFILTALASLAVATGLSREDDPDPIPPSACAAPRTIQCCQSVRNIHDPDVIGILQTIVLLPLPLPADIDPLVGLICTPATGAGGNPSCGQGLNPLCCTNTYQGGLISISIGCVPVDL